MTRSVIVGTAGHIDHGKSALVLALTGTDPDRLKEEKARGITIDLGFAHFRHQDVNFAFVDVPGHERFVRNMLAGAGGIDVVLLVIAADESVMPQTREHFDICRLLQIPAGVVVLTKVDLVDADTLEIVTLEARELVRDSFLENAAVLGVSSRTGEGLDALRVELVRLAHALPARNPDGPARLPIDRVFTMRGFGTVVTGTLTSGSVAPDQTLVALPRGRAVKIRGLQVHGREETRGLAGTRVALNLSGVDVSELARGDTLAYPEAFEPTRRVDVVLDLLPDARPLRHGARVRFHHGTSELFGRVAIAGPLAGEESSSEIRPGASAFCRLRLESEAVLTRGDRFIVRAYSPARTIGGGEVLDPQPARGPIRTAAGRTRFRRLRESAEAAVRSFVHERGLLGLHRAALVSRAGLPWRTAEEIAERLVKSGGAIAVGQLIVAGEAASAAVSRLLAALEMHHRTHPLSEGLAREEARERIFGRAAPDVFDAMVERLVREGRLVARDRLALQGHHVSLTPEEARARAALEQVFQAAKLGPPDVAAAAAAAGIAKAVADRVVQLLLRERTLVRVDTMLFHRDALDAMKADVRALKDTNPSARVDVAAFKERYGISRKYAIPLLEFLDRERVTRRVGDSRVIL